MKSPFCVIVIRMSLVTTNRRCPLNFGNRSLLSSCEGMMKHGPSVYVDFYKISRPCTCIVTPSCDGDLLVFSREAEAEYKCYTEVTVQNTFIFGCPTNVISSLVLNVKINQTVDVRARYESPSTSGTFKHCMGFQQIGGGKGNLSIKCGSPSETTVKTTATVITSPIESTSVAVNDKNTDATRSSIFDSSFDSLLVESTQDYQEVKYIIAGSAAGGALILFGLVVLILISMKMKRSRSTENKERSSKVDMAHKNQLVDSNPGLPDNLLYLSIQPLDELEIKSNYDVLFINKPKEYGVSSMPVNAVPERSRDDTPDVSAGGVYVNF